jgi:hypothetical protein
MQSGNLTRKYEFQIKQISHALLLLPEMPYEGIEPIFLGQSDAIPSTSSIE